MAANLFRRLFRRQPWTPAALVGRDLVVWRNERGTTLAPGVSWTPTGNRALTDDERLEAEALLRKLAGMPKED